MINAFRGVTPVSLRAIQILNDQTRQFATSAFVKLETLPKAVYNQQQDEADFYNAFFSAEILWASDLEQIVQTSDRIAHTYGLAGMDALHIAAALSIQAQSFVTTEKPTKPMHRVKDIQMISIAEISA